MIRAIARRRATDGFENLKAETPGFAADHDLVWIDLGNVEPEEAMALLEGVGLDYQQLDRRSSGPGISEDGPNIYLTVSASQTGDLGRLEVDRIEVAISRNVMVTFHDDPVPTIDRLFSAATLDALDLPTPSALAAALAQSVTRRMIPLIEELEIRVDRLEDKAFGADPQTLAEIHVLRREMITLRRIATRQRDVCSEAANSNHVAIGNSGRESFSRAAGEARRIVESLETSRSLLGSALETYRGAVADETNEIVRLLTVFSAILLPLTLITGIFGMNFVLIPTAKEPWGFWAWIGVMAVVAVGLWTFFVRKGFIGGALLRDLPKSVGVGLVHVSTAPVRAIASGVESTIHRLDPRQKPDE